MPLDETGRSQAFGLAALLASEHFDRAVSSDLSRARETAEIVLAARPLPVKCERDWREMRFGDWEGLTWPQIVARNPELASSDGKTPKFYTPAGGETFDDLCARVARGLERIKSRAKDGDRVLLATHAGVLHALLRIALGESEATALGVRFLPGTLTRIAFENGRARIVDLNRVS